MPMADRWKPDGVSLADLRTPSSTIPRCVNDWGPLETAQPTCEAKAVLAQ